MKIRDLIRELSKQDETLEVVFHDPSRDAFYSSPVDKPVEPAMCTEMPHPLNMFSDKFAVVKLESM